MLDFIRRNKVFSACLSFCLLIILSLSTLVVFKELEIDENVLVLPNILNPNEEAKDPEFSLFKGEFDDEKNSIFLTWDYQLNNHSFQKVELYKGEHLIGTYYDERQVEFSIFNTDICTGYNEFEVILYYDNGMAVTKNADVFVDYVFDIETSHQLVDNNLGRGYLLSITYTYNTNTPAGFPTLDVSTNYQTHGYWKWNQIGVERESLVNNYQKLTVFYLIQFKEFADSDVEWEFDFKFDSVGIRHEIEFVENLSKLEVNTNEIVIKK